MQVRIVQLRSRNPVVVALVLVVVLALLAAVVAVGFTLLAGAAVVGGAGLLARRVLRGRVLRGRALPPADRADAAVRGGFPLDRAREVFPPGRDVPAARVSGAPERRLPPGTDG